jgi:DtxR family Mn-dependent transcriptional regulator
VSPERRRGHTATVDRYLETIYYIAAEDQPVRPSRLSNWLGVSAPTVTEALRRLERDGWITIAPDRTARLTKDGDRVASAIVRRHRVLERWLVDELGFDWAAADIEAEKIATTISDTVIDRIDESMGSPVTCPHGNAIPGRDPGYGALTAVAALNVGASGVIRRVSEVAEHQGQQLLMMLSSGGVAEGTRVTVVAREADGTTVLKVNGGELALARDAAASIWAGAD